MGHSMVERDRVGKRVSMLPYVISKDRIIIVES